MGREVEVGFRMGDTCTLMADSCQCMAKTTTSCKVISLQLKLIKKKKEMHVSDQQPARNGGLSTTK